MCTIAQTIKSERVRRKKRLDPKPWILPWLEGACDRKNLALLTSPPKKIMTQENEGLY